MGLIFAGVQRQRNFQIGGRSLQIKHLLVVAPGWMKGIIFQYYLQQLFQSYLKCIPRGFLVSNSQSLREIESLLKLAASGFILHSKYTPTINCVSVCLKVNECDFLFFVNLSFIDITNNERIDQKWDFCTLLLVKLFLNFLEILHMHAIKEMMYSKLDSAKNIKFQFIH